MNAHTYTRYPAKEYLHIVRRLSILQKCNCSLVKWGVICSEIYTVGLMLRMVSRIPNIQYLANHISAHTFYAHVSVMYWPESVNHWHRVKSKFSFSVIEVIKKGLAIKMQTEKWWHMSDYNIPAYSFNLQTYTRLCARVSVCEFTHVHI